MRKRIGGLGIAGRIDAGAHVANGERGTAARSFARYIALRFALPIAGWTLSIASVLLFGLPPLAAIALLLLATSPALFAPTDRPQ